MGEHCETHCLPRLKKVVDGEDPGGITQAVGWKGAAVSATTKDGYMNLTVKKIPNAVLTRCEWGKDDYSLKVENFPKVPPEPGQQELF